MTTLTGPSGRPSVGSLTIRGAGFLALWAILIGTASKDLIAGVAAAGAATWASIALWPLDASLSGFGLIRFIMRFLPQSVLAGVEVARQAFAVSPILDEGFVPYRPALPMGMAHGALRAVMSLQPGKLPIAADEDGTLWIHCLDVNRPVAKELSADEAAFLRILRDEESHG